MAFPKKGIRKISVNGVKYGYNVTGNDGWISFSIGLLEENGQLLTGYFSYHSNMVTNFKQDGKIASWLLFQRVRITPHTIRQVIEYALENGWNPKEKKGELRLGDMDDKVELNLKEATPFPALKEGQVALNFAQLEGRMLTLKQELYAGEGEIYQVFDSLTEAKAFARKTVQADPKLECWIMTEKDKAVCYITAFEEKVFV